MGLQGEVRRHGRGSALNGNEMDSHLQRKMNAADQRRRILALSVLPGAWLAA
jgi:hypothetical protein